VTTHILTWFTTFRPAATRVSAVEQVRSASGALLGILLTGLVSSWWVGAGRDLPLLIAPMGASAVLLFAVPSSPLAQPWSIIGGNLVAGFVGVTAARMIGDPVLAASAAIGIAIALMFVLRCIHPPSGAVALTAVLGGAAIHRLGYGFVLAPVLLNSILLTLVALAFNNATRRTYPHAQVAAETRHRTSDPSPMQRLVSKEDLDAVLSRYDQVLEIGRPDMDALIQATEMQAYRRRFDGVTCADIMSRDVVSVEWGTPLQEAWVLMRRRRFRAMPVVDKARHVVGVVADIDFMNDVGLDTYTSLAARFHRLIAAPTSDTTDRPEVVGQIMSKGVRTATLDTHIVDLVPLMADSGLRHVPIVDAAAHLVGLVAQSDLIAALYRTNLVGGSGAGITRSARDMPETQTA
jgi:CBS domain-containing membrane protein